MPDLDAILDKLPGPLEGVGRVLADTIDRFVQDACPDLAAGLAFYSVFSLAPLLVVFTHAASALFDTAVVNALLVGLASDLAGNAGAAQVREVLSGIDPSKTSALGGWLSVGLSLFGATSVLVQLQTALNRVWNVQQAGGNVIKVFLLKRATSLVMLLGIGLVFFLSVLLSSVLSAIGDPDGPWLLRTYAAVYARLAPYVDIGVSWLLFTGTFATLFRYIPDTDVAWGDALRGAVITSALFVVGKQAIAWYLGTTAMGSMYGAAGSLAVLITWIFYSSIILLFGAELTQSWAAHRAGRRNDEPVPATP